MSDYGTIRHIVILYAFSSSDSSFISSLKIKPVSKEPQQANTSAARLSLKKVFQSLNLRDPQIAAEITLIETTHPIKIMTQDVPILPDLTVESFDGTSSGARFLMALRINLRPIELNTWPGLWIQAVYIKVMGEAAVWIDITPHIISLVDSIETVTIAQRDSFDKEFKEQFPGTRIDLTRAPDHLELTHRQRADESLQAYEFRATEVWRKIVEVLNLKSVKDIATSIGYLVFVSAFVSGLYINIRRIQPIRQGVVTVGTILKAIQAINRAHQITASEILFSQRAENIAFNSFQNMPSSQRNVHAACQATLA